MRVRQILPVAIVVASLGCGASPPPDTIRLTTPSFSVGSDIPVTYTCRADNQSPPFAWDNLPPNTRSLVFLVEDLSTNRTNWLVYDIDPSSTGTPENGVADGGVVGRNSDGKEAYGGPCGPAGSFQRYAFRVIALNVKLGLPAGITRAQLNQAMKGHMLAQGEIQATDAGD